MRTVGGHRRCLVGARPFGSAALRRPGAPARYRGLRGWGSSVGDRTGFQHDLGTSAAWGTLFTDSSEREDILSNGEK
jgi:hypothetical protein